jgi:YjbE family integral membrane protein
MILRPTLAGPLAAFFQVVLIDVTLAGDNAVAVGMAAAGLPAKDRRRAIIFGMGGAVVLLVGFALIAVQLLKVIGLLLAGGFLLLWVCWKMYRDLRQAHAEQEGEEVVENALAGGHHAIKAAKPPKTLMAALLQILLADISMSLDNVLAVAGAAREHPQVLIFGLLLSVSLTAVAATFIAKLLNRWRWLGYVGLAMVLFVSARMIWEGHRDVVESLGKTAPYNAVMPDALDIKPKAPEATPER